ncbi:MAG: HD domain-containing protein [Clostridia bacterium]|nr:HD domain-containing protein [Clostridia bacterium]
MINNEIKDYITNEILPKYKDFDKGHDIRHIKEVIKHSLEYYEYLNDENIDPNMVFVIAAYHDLGISVEREHHAIHSAELLLKDEKLRDWFSEEQMEIMAEACEDHSTSLNREPYTIYGKIVCDADKDNNVTTSLSRAWDYSVQNFPTFTKQELLDNVYEQLVKKFGKGGLVRFYIDSQKNIDFVAKMKILTDNRETFQTEMLNIVNKRSFVERIFRDDIEEFLQKFNLEIIDAPYPLWRTGLYKKPCIIVTCKDIKKENKNLAVMSAFGLLGMMGSLMNAGTFNLMSSRMLVFNSLVCYESELSIMNDRDTVDYCDEWYNFLAEKFGKEYKAYYHREYLKQQAEAKKHPEKDTKEEEK